MNDNKFYTIELRKYLTKFFGSKSFNFFKEENHKLGKSWKIVSENDEEYVNDLQVLFFIKIHSTEIRKHLTKFFRDKQFNFLKVEIRKLGKRWKIVSENDEECIMDL